MARVGCLVRSKKPHKPIIYSIGPIHGSPQVPYCQCACRGGTVSWLNARSIHASTGGLQIRLRYKHELEVQRNCR
jgi:hypothetical protein